MRFPAEVPWCFLIHLKNFVYFYLSFIKMLNEILNIESTYCLYDYFYFLGKFSKVGPFIWVSVILLLGSISSCLLQVVWTFQNIFCLSSLQQYQPPLRALHPSAFCGSQELSVHPCQQQFLNMVQNSLGTFYISERSYTVMTFHFLAVWHSLQPGIDLRPETQFYKRYCSFFHCL